MSFIQIAVERHSYLENAPIFSIYIRVRRSEYYLQCQFGLNCGVLHQCPLCGDYCDDNGVCDHVGAKSTLPPYNRHNRPNKR